MTPKPCACAPGCRNEVAPGTRLCEDCSLAISKTPAWRRFFEAPTMQDANRHLAAWARTRSAELHQERLRVVSSVIT